jgi:MFS family permease
LTISSPDSDSNRLRLTTGKKSLFLLNISFFLVFSNVSLFYLYPIILKSWGTETKTIGLVMGVFSLTAVLSRPFMGRIASRKGEFVILGGGIILMLISSSAYSVIKEVNPFLYVIRMAHGIGFSGFIAGAFSMIARGVEPEFRGKAFSRVGAFIMGAIAFVPPLCELLINGYGIDVFYFMAVLIMILALISVIPIKGYSGVHIITPAQGAKGYLSLLRDTDFCLLLITTIVFSHTQSAVFNFLALFAHQKGVQGGPFFFSAFSIAIIILLFTGRFLDRWGMIIFLRIFYPLFLMGIVLIPSMIKPGSGLIPSLMFGAGMGFVFPCLNAIAAGFGSHVDKPRVMSLFTGTYDAGFISGAMVSGWIGNILGLDMIFYSAGVIGLMGALPLYFRHTNWKG